jgi:hypothetical protein
MARPVYKLYEGSLQHRFQLSRAKIQMYGGGFANGKTTSAVIKALQLARDYPGSNGLLARSTYPKLNDTLRKEFLKWCPPEWIKRSALTENIVELTNGSVINFRYIAQQGKNTDSSTSNLLSATYDYIVVDQIEDPEIVDKDFDDLLGRLRGNTPYTGDDPSMPDTGPRWFIITCNPTRNWVYKKLVNPLHDYNSGRYNPELLCAVNDDGTPVMVDGMPVPLMELFEGSTYENKENLAGDFIKTLEAAYRGQMRDRYLLGQWAAYEGLVYPTWDSNSHFIKHDEVVNYYMTLQRNGFKPTILEGYDHGLAAPSCYLFAFVDHVGNVCIMDGFYEKEKQLDWLGPEIKRIRREYNVVDKGMESPKIFADPALFRRTPGTRQTVGLRVAGMFQDYYDIFMVQGNNDITSGIHKVSGYLNPQAFHRSPFTGEFNSPYLYVSDRLPFFENEVTNYYWAKDTYGEYTDKPVDRNDHCMDALKYMLSKRPAVATVLSKIANGNKPAHMRWNEIERTTDQRKHRYG